MRIAYLASRLPYPPIGGDRLRAYYMLRHMLRTHQVTLYALASPLPGGDELVPDELSPLDRKFFRLSKVGYAWNAARGFFSHLPLQVKLYESKELYQVLRADVARGAADLLFVHLIRMAEYVAAHPKIPRVLDMVDSICMHYHRMCSAPWNPRWWGARLDRKRICRYEAEMPQRFNAVLLTSPVDLAWVARRTRAENLMLVPNGVDLGRFKPLDTPIDPRRIVFCGKLDSLPNADAAIYFAKEILPQVRTYVSDAHFVVAGWNPPAAVRSLAQLPGVTVRANVPDLRSEIAASAVSVAPLRFGAGIQNKVLESLAMGVPVVSTLYVAQAIGDGESGPVLIGRTAEEFAGKVAQVLRDAGFREHLARASRELVKSRYRWDQALAPLDHLLEKLGTGKLTKQNGVVVS